MAGHPRVGRLGFGVLAVLVASGCSGGSDSSESDVRVQVTLRAQSLTEGPVRGSEVDRAVAILADRLDHAGIGGTVTQGSGSRVFVRIDRARSGDGERIVELSTKTGLLELYDLEANLVTPSIDANRSPVATALRYDLLVGRQVPVREDDVESWYLFDPERKLAGGPAPSKRLLLPGRALLDGWRILGVPPGTVVLECGIGEVVCPGVNVENPRTDSYYLIRYDPPQTPDLDGADLELEGTYSDLDTLTGEPIVVMRFTEEGGNTFGEITNREADRGKALFNPSGGGGDPINTFQHFAVVVDREIKSWPSIDWEQYPNGISGTNGAQITGIGDISEAKNLALVLRSGALPLRFEFLARRETSG